MLELIRVSTSMASPYKSLKVWVKHFFGYLVYEIFLSPESWRGSLYMYLLSIPRFWTLSIERFWFLFRSILNGVTPKTSNYLLQEKQLESIERYKMRVSIGEDQMDALRVLGYCPGGGGYSWEFLVGVCRPVRQILTLFQTKKCHFLHPFSDPTSKIHTRFQTWPLRRNYFTIT